MQQRLTLMPRCLQLWDLRVETSPVATYKVHEFLRPKVRTYVRSQFVVTETKKCFRISFWHQREDGQFFREKKMLLICLLVLQLSKLYTDDYIFDRFGCCASNDGAYFATGSYRFLVSSSTETRYNTSLL